MPDWYCGSVQHAAIAQFAISTAYSVGNIVRQLAAPAVGNERAFRCTTAGTSGGTEPSWSLTKGSTTSTGTAVFTEVTGNSTYGWAAAAARIDRLAAWALNGDTAFIASNHDETRAATLTVASTNPAIFVRYISVDPAGSVPPVAADYLRGAAVRVTGANEIRFINGNGFYFGIDFYAGSATDGGIISLGVTSNTGASNHELYDCSLNLIGTGSGGLINIGNTIGYTAGCRTLFDNVKVSFAATGQSIRLGPGVFDWRNTSGAITGATFPTSLFTGSTGSATGAGTFTVDGVDLNAITGTLVAALPVPFIVNFANCRINASATLAAAPTVVGAAVNMAVCDDGATGYKQARQTYAGKLTQEATIVRTGGASDGVAAISHKIVTNANTKRHTPFEGFPLAIWNTATGVSKTLTVELVNDGVTLTNNDFFIEVEYLGNASYPMASMVSSAPATPLTAASNLPSSVEAWNTTGLASPVKQYASVSFTPQLAGLVRVRVFVTKASQTLYYCPKVTIS